MAQLKKLQFARSRLLSDVRHSLEAALNLTKVSKPLLIACKDRTLERYWTEFQANVEKIVHCTEAMTDENTFFEENQKVEDDYHTAKIHLAEILPAADGEISINRSFYAPPNGGAAGGGDESRVKSFKSHLPNIKIDPFDGNYDNWNRFSQMFPKMIAKEQLDSIDKLYYLNQSLTGEPLLLIKHLPVSNDSYEQAWALLKKTYEVRRHIVNSQFDLFFSIKKMENETCLHIA